MSNNAVRDGGLDEIVTGESFVMKGRDVLKFAETKLNVWLSRLKFICKRSSQKSWNEDIHKNILCMYVYTYMNLMSVFSFHLHVIYHEDNKSNCLNQSDYLLWQFELFVEVL